jgi:autotransporter-associated beta strand protein
LAPDSLYYFKWDFNTSGGSSQGIGLDNFSLTATTAPAATPNIELSSPAASASNLTEGVTNQVLSRFDLAVTTANATLTGVTINTSGTYVASDLSNLKCWYSADNSFSSSTDVLLSTKSSSLGTGSHAFPSFTNQIIASGNTGYIFITADVPFGSTVGNAISVSAVDTGNLTFSSGTKSGSTNASGTKTIVACTPTNATSLVLTAGSTQLTVSWANPTCVDEVMIVAKPTSTIGASPSGDGSSYSANLVFGSGSTFDGTGSVVYKGSSSPQIITGLNNGTAYFVRVFTRRGSVWSSGTESSATPSLTNATRKNYTGSSGGAWLTSGNWSPSGVPTSSQLAAFAGAQTSVGINMNTNGGETVGAIEVESGKTNNILLGNSSGSGSGTLTLIGVIVNGIENVVLRNNNTNLLTLQNPLTNQTTLMNLAFANGTNNKILVDSSGGITISSAITSASGPVTVGGTGSGTVTFSGQNTFSTQTSVEGATLRLNRSGGTTLPVTNNMSVSNGTLKISTNQALNDLSLTGGTLLVDAGATLTINGTMTVSGGTITNNGTIAYGASGALMYGSSARTVGAEWPASNGPLNVTVGTGGVTLGVERTISSTGKLTLNGVFATGDSLTLASDTNGTAVVIGGTNSDLTGNVTVQRFLPWSSANHNGYRFVGHPLRSNPVLNTVTNLPSTSNTVIGYNNASNSYTAVSDRTTTWPQATGYGVWTSGATNTLAFSGELQLDAVPAVAMGTATNRWNYAANPFPSVMDWHEVTKTNIEGTIYRWDKSTATLSAGSSLAAGTWGTYVQSTQVTANGGSRYMAPMQGFMVQASSGASSASLAYPSSARVDQPANYVRQQQTADVARARVTHQPSGFGLETVLCFLPQASIAYDANLEARYVSDGVAASQDLYTQDAQGQTYSIQSLPELALNAQTRIPLYLTHTQAGAAYTWNMDLSGLTTGHQAWLEDTRLGTLTPIVTGQAQPFTAQAGDAVDRFHLVFAAQGTAVQALESVEKVTAHLSNGRLNLRGLRQGPATLLWMDLSGRVLGHETLNDSDQVLTCPTFLQEGHYYLLSVQSPQGSYHFRLRR